jgi:malonyl CoA-acyl carrier protein transacylase
MDDLTEDYNCTHKIPKHLRAAMLCIPIIEAYGESKEPNDTILADLLADLHHWAVANEVDWYEAVDRAEQHWFCETP